MTLPVPTAVQTRLMPVFPFMGCYGQPQAVALTPAPVYEVCPHCKREVITHRFMTGAFTNRTFHCREHGDVVPMRSAICNAPL